MISSIASLRLSRSSWKCWIAVIASCALAFLRVGEAFSSSSQCNLLHLHPSPIIRRSSINWNCWRCNTFWISRSSLRIIPVGLLYSHSFDSLEERCEEQTTRLEVQKCWKLPRLYVGSRHSNRHGNLSLTSGAQIHLSPDQTHYLTNVMRIFKKGKNKNVVDNDVMTIGRDCVRIFNGEDGEWLAKVHQSSDEQHESSNDVKGRSKRRSRSSKQNKDPSLVAECILRLREQDCCEDERPWILFAPLKKQPRMKNMIEKCTELGVGRMIPVASDRTEGGAIVALLGPSSDEPLDVVYGKPHHADDINIQFDKLEIQSIEAAEQCERLSIPSVTTDITLTPCKSSHPELWNVRSLVEHWEESQILNENENAAKSGVTDIVGSIEMIQSEKRVLLICRERGSVEDTDDSGAKVVPVLHALNDNLHVAFLVGPEGGWSAEEEDLFEEICSKYSGMSNAPVRCVSLGSSVLRAETCCMMAVGAWALANDSQ